MIKNKKLNLINATKLTLSLATIFTPLFLNSNITNASPVKVLRGILKVTNSPGVYNSNGLYNRAIREPKFTTAVQLTQNPQLRANNGIIRNSSSSAATKLRKDLNNAMQNLSTSVTTASREIGALEKNTRGWGEAVNRFGNGVNSLHTGPGKNKDVPLTRSGMSPGTNVKSLIKKFEDLSSGSGKQNKNLSGPPKNDGVYYAKFVGSIDD